MLICAIRRVHILSIFVFKLYIMCTHFKFEDPTTMHTPNAFDPIRVNKKGNKNVAKKIKQQNMAQY